MAAVEELGLEIAVKGFAAFIADMQAADKATGKLAVGWTAAGKAAAGATGKLASLSKSIGVMAKHTKVALEAIQPVGVALSAMSAAGIVAIGGMVKQAVEFESQAALMAIASGETGDAFQELSNAAIKVGGDTRLVGVSASGAAESITELFKAGLTSSEVFGDLNKFMKEGAELGGVLRASIDLAAASELSMAQGSEVLAVAMKTFGISSSEASSIADNFVQTADASVASVSELTAALANVGPDAASFGFSLKNVNTALALLSERGIKGAEAGTALKSMMTNLMRPTDAVKETLKELNIELFTEQGVMKSLPDILGNLSDSMAGLTDKQRTQAVQTLAGTFGMKAMNTLLAEGTDGWQEMEVAISNASTAAEIAAVQAATLAGRIEAFKGSLETAQITLGNQFTPALGDAVDAGTNLLEAFNNLSPGARKVTATLLGVGTAITGAAGAFILLTPRIIATVQAAATMIPIMTQVVRGLQLLKAGAAASQVATASFAGSLAVALPIIIAVTAAVAALVAIHKTAVAVEKHHTDVSDAYADSLKKQAGEGKSATEIARNYAAAQRATAQALEGTNPIIRAFIDEQRLARESTEELTTTLAASASSYREYEMASQEAARAAGFQIDEMGNLVEIHKMFGEEAASVVQQNYLLTESQFAVQNSLGVTAETMEFAATTTDNWSTSMSSAWRAVDDEVAETTESIVDFEAQINALNELMAGPVGEENDKYAEAQAAIKEKITETTHALSEAEKEFGVASNEAAAHRQKLGELRSEVETLAEAHRAAMNKIVFDMLTARLATDGWTEAETNLALSIAEDMGLIDEDTRVAAVAMNEALEDFATGAGQAETMATIEEIAGQLAAIPRDIQINIRVRRELSEARTAPGRLGGETYQKGTPFVRRTGQALLHRGEAVLPVPMATAFRQSIANNNTTQNFNLTTQSTTRPGGLAMEFGAMAFVGAGVSR
jgi:TP901 family phage tail tape measure protein